jgi:glutaredoxin
LIAGIYVLSVIKYKYESTCPRCKKHYAIGEKENPQIREVEAHDGIKRTTTHHYFCKYCDFEKKVPHTETIPYEEAVD